MSMKHGMEMFQKNEKPHLNAMNKMKELMKTTENMKNWFDNKKRGFEELPENKK